MIKFKDQAHACSSIIKQATYLLEGTRQESKRYPKLICFKNIRRYREAY